MRESDSAAETSDGKGAKLIRVALVLTALAVLSATYLLVRETAYNFVLFMFLGPPLILASAACLVWVIVRELRRKSVL